MVLLHSQGFAACDDFRRRRGSGPLAAQARDANQPSGLVSVVADTGLWPISDLHSATGSCCSHAAPCQIHAHEHTRATADWTSQGVYDCSS